MEPIHWIVIIWAIGTCIATLMMITHIEDDSNYTRLRDKYSMMYHPKFVLLLFYISAFVHEFFWWWLTIPKMIFAWVRIQIISLAVKRMIRLASSDDPERTAKMEKLMKAIKSIA